MNCPHCDSRLTPHEGGGAKEGALHCYVCGCCFLADGTTSRPGTPVCALAEIAAEEMAVPKQEVESDDDETITTTTTPRRGRPARNKA